MNIHEKYISRCIELGKLAIGNSYPNPAVGCCIVHKDTIIGEGYTSSAGGNHAEINAIESVKDKSKLKESTLYVTLEPCSHYGKTPPCTNEITKNKIPKVVIGLEDPYPKVSGAGIKKLKDAGVQVDVGVLKKECEEHHKRFLTYINKNRPYIILKWAETNDGFIAPKTKKEIKPVWISNKYSRQLVHKWRAEEQAIVVGANTIREDNPELTTRKVIGKNPKVIIINKRNDLDKKSNVFKTNAEKIIISEKTINYNKPIASQISKLLYQQEITSLIVEGGATTLNTFINENIWDEARIFKSPVEIENGIKAPTIKFNSAKATRINEDKLLIIYNK